MSKRYLEAFGQTKIQFNEMREFLRPKFPVDQDGKPIYLTEQAHLAECNVNNIIRKYDKTGLINHVNKIEADYGDMSGADYKTMLDKLCDIRQKFDKLPSKIRNRFRNDPAEYLGFMENPDNRDEAVRLGIIQNDWTPATDGLGEHIKEDKDRKKVEPKPLETPAE